jgi:uncharacterized membrane protein YcaP (DUF421 family)
LGISFIRTILLYTIVVAAVRVMGKREIGELQPSELVVAILISELAAIPMQETGIPLTSGVIPILTLISCEIILSSITLLSTKARRLISGRPSVLIINGRIDQGEMRKLRFTIDDLMEELRISGYMNVTEVAFAVLETNGKLSVFPTCPNKPVTAGMMNLNCPDGGLPVTLISDGTVYVNALNSTGKNMTWLLNQLSSQNLTPQNVFLMTVDSLDTTMVIPKEK